MSPRIFCLVLLLSLSAASPAATRQLSFEERVEAQRAIERVYYSHQIGATRSFEEAVPEEVLERKVRTYLKQSAILDEVWKTPVTAEALWRELERIERGTQLPERLVEVYEALGDDAFLIQETFARASLVNRLARGFFAQDERFASTSWDARWRERKERLDERTVPAVAGAYAEITNGPPRSAGGSCPVDSWNNGILDDAPLPRNLHSAVWTGSVMIVWGGESDQNGLRYDPATDTWSRISSVGEPEPRLHHVTVWTGTEMIVWGGQQDTIQTALSTGARYNPTTDTWSPISTMGAPEARGDGPTAVWTGAEMIVWGGRSREFVYLDSGGIYDPVSDSWSSTSLVDAPAGRSGHVAVWTGTRMIVQGGRSASGEIRSGGQYDPASGAWSPISETLDAPVGSDHAAVWTGNEMLTWPGGRYDPATDAWVHIPFFNAPIASDLPTVLWTGTEMLVWGGDPFAFGDPTGSRYDPVTNAWTRMSRLNEPEARGEHTAVWTGERMIVWGGTTRRGQSAQVSLDTGGRYDPETDTWTPTGIGSAPAGRNGARTVWTGSQMIIWGGQMIGGLTIATGGRYDPLIDDWLPTSEVDAPSSRIRFTMVWTGQEMIVWGGLGIGLFDALSYPPDGGRYDPIADTWEPTSMEDSPTPREFHAAVWTGDEMLVYGGRGPFATSGSGIFLQNNGAAYEPVSDTWNPISSPTLVNGFQDPLSFWTGELMIVWADDEGQLYRRATDSWQPMSTTGRPDAQGSASWTGEEMIVWGGRNSSTFYDTGKRYDPVGNSWSPMSTMDAPQARDEHISVWTGDEMIIWGGRGEDFIDRNDGGRYDPATDSWMPISTGGAPSPRRLHSAVWADTMMLVWGRERSGGRYFPEAPGDSELDGDGYVCSLDCDDADPDVHPGAEQICDGVNNDCSHPTWPGLSETNEADKDDDLVSECSGDCNDTDASIGPHAVELPGNRIDEDCDGVHLCDPDAEYGSRGEFNQCIRRACRDLMSEGLVTREQCRGIHQETIGKPEG